MAGLLDPSPRHTLPFQSFLHLKTQSKTLKSGRGSQQSVVNCALGMPLSGIDSCASTASAAPWLIMVTELFHVEMGPLVQGGEQQKSWHMLCA